MCIYDLHYLPLIKQFQFSNCLKNIVTNNNAYYFVSNHALIFEGLNTLTFKIKKIFEAEAVINDLLLEIWLCC